MGAKKFAIAILSFNRPDYLEPVLSSLAAQVGFKGEDILSQFDIYFFQDSLRTMENERLDDPGLEQHCVNVFERRFLEGSVVRQDYNLGIALHFDFIERFLFLDKTYEFTVFLEDDMVLSYTYLATLRVMHEKFKKDQRVGMVAAYGASPRKPLPDQELNRLKLAPMQHNWGFGITRDFWIKRQTLVDEYLDKFIRGRVYSRRDNAAIIAWLKNKGFKPTSTSQDYIKGCSTLLLDAIRITCYPNLAKYIGKEGQNFKASVYEAAGYGDTILYPKVCSSFEDLTDERYRKILARQRSQLLLDQAPDGKAATRE